MGLALPPDQEQTLFPSLALQLAGEDLVDLRDHEAVQRSVEHSQPEIVLYLAAQPLGRRSYGYPIGTPRVQESCHPSPVHPGA